MSARVINTSSIVIKHLDGRVGAGLRRWRHNFMPQGRAVSDFRIVVLGWEDGGQLICCLWEIDRARARLGWPRDEWIWIVESVAKAVSFQNFGFSHQMRTGYCDLLHVVGGSSIRCLQAVRFELYMLLVVSIALSAVVGRSSPFFSTKGLKSLLLLHEATRMRILN